MESRRDLLKKLGLGAAVAATAATTAAGLASAARAEHRRQLQVFAEGGNTTAEPWWLLHPLQAGSRLSQGWRVSSLSAVERGAAIIELQHRDGRPARLHVCAHRGSPRGFAHTALFDLVLMDGGRGDQPTDEGLGKALLGLTRRIRRNEVTEGVNLDSVARMLTHGERVQLYGPETLT